MAGAAEVPVPQEALDYLRAKRLRPAFDHRDVWKEEHASNFTVAKVTQIDVLAAVKTSFEQAIAKGETLATWKKSLKPELAKAGWWGPVDVVDDQTGEVRTTDLSSPARLRTIYETNMRSARAAAQWQRIERTRRFLPYLLYEIGPSAEHRQEHVSWHGTLLRSDDPWWRTHMPQNGWGCKCRVRQVGPAEYDRLTRDGLASPVLSTDPKTGKIRTVQESRDGVPTGRLKMERRSVATEAPPRRTREWVNTRTGEIDRVPLGIDPGFNQNPGIEFRMDQQVRQLQGKLASLPAVHGAFCFEVLAPNFQSVISRDFERWGRAVLARGQPRKELRIVGALRPGVARRLAERQLEPASAAIAIRDEELLHAARDAKAARRTADGRPKSLSDDELLQLPDMLADPQAVLLDLASRTLFYVLPAARREAAKIVVRMDMRYRAEGGKITINAFKTASLVDYGDLAKDLKAGSLELLAGELER